MENTRRVVLFPVEVIGLIFDQVEAEGRDESLAEFANLARSCHAFTGIFYSSFPRFDVAQLLVEPALNKLWKVQVTLAPLIRCMPEDLWDQGTEGDVVQALVSAILP